MSQRRREILERRSEGRAEVIGERGKTREEMQKRQQKRKKKKLVVIKGERERERERDRVPVLSSFLSLPPRDSARLPKLCLDLNRSRLEKYLPASPLPSPPSRRARICSPEIFQRLSEGYIPRGLQRFSLRSRRAVSLPRDPPEYRRGNCIADRYEPLCIEFVAPRGLFSRGLENSE